jgi:hypothetical protein
MWFMGIGFIFPQVLFFCGQGLWIKRRQMGENGDKSEEKWELSTGTVNILTHD